jgi:hypothetical protein
MERDGRSTHIRSRNMRLPFHLVSRSLRATSAALCVAFFPTSPAAAQARVPSSADSAAIKTTALDYIEGWYEGNGERMERALHPELAKRIMYQPTQAGGRSRLDSQSAMTLVRNTRAGGGKRTPPEKQQKDVTILDIYENAASVKVVAGTWIDYLHMARAEGRWQIVNVLWELKPQPAAP